MLRFTPIENARQAEHYYSKSDGGYHLDDLFGIGAELLTTLAFRQLELGQSAVLDFPVEDPATRTRWRSLADAAGAQFRVIVCTCSDRELHRARLERNLATVLQYVTN